jgi:hypothetical protein
MDYVSDVSPVLDLAAIAFGGVPILGQVLIVGAIAADVISAADSAINAREEIRKNGLDGDAAVDLVGLVTSLVGLGGLKLATDAEKEAGAAYDASKAAEKHLGEYPRSVKRQNAHAAAVAQLSVKSRTLGTALAVSGAAGLASDVNTLGCDGGMTCSSSFNPLHP